MPLVTVVVPLHDHQSWICDALDSIDRQDYHDKEIVVVDDGSTDNSRNVVLSSMANCYEVPIGVDDQKKLWVGQYSQTKMTVLGYPPAGRGPSFARNRGIEVALSRNATHIAFLDSDDLYEPTKLSRSMEEFAKNPAVGAVYSDYDTLRPDGLRLRQFKPPFSRQHLLRECIVNCDSVVSSEAIKAIGGFDETLRVCEDFDVWLRLSESYLISHVPESLVVIRVGEHSSTSQVASETWKRCYARVFEKLKTRANGG